MNEMINNFQIVVSRFNENINWLSNFKNITIVYNKGNNDKHLNDFNVINLPNFGRESHTFLYHIINNYDNLKEYTIFFQGSLKFDKNIKHNQLSLENYFQTNDFNATLQKVDSEPPVIIMSALPNRIESKSIHLKIATLVTILL